LFAGLIIILLLAVSTVMITTISSPTSNASDKDQLKVTAEKIMTQMLLDSGYPYDWGSISAAPQVFGLAKYGETSRQAYELDPDKVLRLNEGLPSYVNATIAANLLGLGNSNDPSHEALDYGFTLEFNEILQISAPQPSASGYSITVTSEYNLPIIGANVSATLYYIDNNEQIAHQGPANGTTAYDGSFTLPFNFNPSTGSAEALAVAVDYYGAQAVKFFYPTTNTLLVTLFGSSLIPNPPYTINSAREILLIQTTQGYETRDFAVNTINFTLSNPPESSAIAVIAVSGSNLLVADRDFSNISYRTIPAIRSGAFAYSLERIVLIGGTTYTATLYLWRMSS
jgi:hypothetical protein